MAKGAAVKLCWERKGGVVRSSFWGERLEIRAGAKAQEFRKVSAIKHPCTRARIHAAGTCASRGGNSSAHTHDHCSTLG